MALPDAQTSPHDASIIREKKASISTHSLLQSQSNTSNNDSLLPDTQQTCSRSSSRDNAREPDVELEEPPNITIVTPSILGQKSSLVKLLSDELADLQDLKNPILGSFNPNPIKSDVQSESLNLELSCKDFHTNSDSQLPATRIGTPNPPSSPAASFQASFLTSPPEDSVLCTQLLAAQTSQVPLSRESSYPVADLNSLASDSFSAKSPLNKISCLERKRIVVSSNRPPSLTKAMNHWVNKTQYLLDPFREDNDCWFHPAPPPGRPNAAGILRPCGIIQKTFTWQDRNGKHSIVLNYGIVHKLVNYNMSKQEKDGFINKRWHLSHLCGNWTCLNPRHTTVEPGSINIKRNNCFSHRSGCQHKPPCMKEKKVPLGPDGKLTDHNARTKCDAKPRTLDTWDEWSAQSFDDGEESMFIDNAEDSDFVATYADEDEDEF